MKQKTIGRYPEKGQKKSPVPEDEEKELVSVAGTMEKGSSQEEFAANLRAICEKRGIRATELAEATGIPESTLSNAFSGKTDLKLSTIRLLTAALDVSADELIFGRKPNQVRLQDATGLRNDAVDQLVKLHAMDVKAERETGYGHYADTLNDLICSPDFLELMETLHTARRDRETFRAWMEHRFPLGYAHGNGVYEEIIPGDVDHPHYYDYISAAEQEVENFARMQRVNIYDIVMMFSRIVQSLYRESELLKEIPDFISEIREEDKLLQNVIDDFYRVSATKT